MNRLIPLFVGAVGILVFATIMLVVLPGLQVRTVSPATSCRISKVDRWAAA